MQKINDWFVNVLSDVFDFASWVNDRMEPVMKILKFVVIWWLFYYIISAVYLIHHTHDDVLTIQQRLGLLDDKGRLTLEAQRRYDEAKRRAYFWWF